MESQQYRAARWYARHNWYVVPLHAPITDEAGACVGCTCEMFRRRKNPHYGCDVRSRGKHPILAGWEGEASTDLDIVAEWWRRWPWANVGIAAGKSGLLVLDVDLYKDAYAAASVLSSADELTITSITGSGGSHLIYLMPDGVLYGNNTGSLPAGIDIRGHGGQFVAPPSIHPSGNRYQWETGYGPHEIAPLPLPERLRQLLDAHSVMNTPEMFGEGVMDAPDLGQWRLSGRILDYIHHPAELGRRSETDQAVITALVACGATNDEIRAVFEHYPIGREGKFAAKGRYGLQYLATSIEHARGYNRRQEQEKIEQRAAALLMAAAAR